MESGLQHLQNTEISLSLYDLPRLRLKSDFFFYISKPDTRCWTLPIIGRDSDQSQRSANTIKNNL